MQVNHNIPVKTLQTIKLIIIIVLIIMVVALVLTFIQSSKYEKTQGTVASVQSMARVNSVSKGRIVHYVEYTYEVNGQILRSNFRTMFPGRLNVGEHITVYYDSLNPQKTQDLFIREGLTIGILFTSVFLAFLLKIISVRKQM